MKARQKKDAESLSVKTLSLTSWAFPLLVLAVVVLASLFVLIPQAQQLMDERKDVERQEEKLDRLTNKRSVLESMDDVTLQSQLIEVTRALPNEKPVFAFLSSLVGLVEELEGLEIASYDFSPGLLATESADLEEQNRKSNVGQLSSMKIEIQFEGNIDLILDLIDSLEGMAPLADVKGFELRGELISVETAEESNTIDMVLNLYYSVPPKEIGKPTDPIVPFSEKDLMLVDELTQLTTYDGYGDLVEAILDQQREDIFSF